MMKNIFSIILMILAAISLVAGIFGGVGYVGIYLGIYHPIKTICAHIDAETLTASIAGKELLFFFLRGALTTLVVGAGVMGAAFLSSASRSLSLYR